MKKILMVFAGVMSAMVAEALPSGYTQVEYIESTKGGGQYIDTDYTAGANTKVVIDAYLPSKDKQYDDSVVLFGTRSTPDESKGIDWSTKAFSIQLLGLEHIRFAYNGEYFDSPVVSFGERRTITCDNKYVEWTGSDAGSKAVTVSPLERSKSSLYIFGDNTVAVDDAKRDGAFNRSIMRLYSFKIYEGDALKRDFVPCVKTTTGEAGLWDLVEGKFYGNKGSNEGFVVGSAVETVECYDPIGEANITVTAIMVTEGTAIFEDGVWYVVKGEVTRDTITVNGSANLILANDAKLTVNGGIWVDKDNALTIYAQEGGNGELIANGVMDCAGIGGRNPDRQDGYGNCGTITINGGVVTAKNDYSGGAGIGSGYCGDGGTVTINGGVVTATSNNTGAGIGGGMNGNGGEVTINGGVVTATSTARQGGAGIGGGRNDIGIISGDGGTVTINGGTVTATSVYSAGIGGGTGYGGSESGDGGTVTINGGTVTATSTNSAGIGGGDGGAGGTVEINGGNIKASSIQSEPTNKEAKPVYCVTVESVGKAAAIEKLPEYYGTKDIVPINGNVYFYLPNGNYEFWVNNISYTAIVKDGSAEAERSRRKVTIDGDWEHLITEWTSGEGAVTNAVENGFFEVECGAENVKVLFMPAHHYRFANESEDGVRTLTSPIIESCTVTAPEIVGISGTEAAPWPVGENVTAYVSDEMALVIGGEGAMSDFASVEEVPWAEVADKVTAVQVANGVTLGKNALAGFADTMTVNGLTISSFMLAVGGSEPVIPEGMVLVTKEAITAAKATTIAVEGNEVKLGVSVKYSEDITAEPSKWEELEPVIITIPVKSKQGFMLLNSREGRVTQ